MTTTTPTLTSATFLASVASGVWLPLAGSGLEDAYLGAAEGAMYAEIDGWLYVACVDDGRLVLEASDGSGDAWMTHGEAGWVRL